ncbi:MAG: histidine phosphatase family protein [Pseudomonadota bacterium]
MPTVDFVRHGETTEPGRLNGRSDPPLSADGWSQVRGQLRRGAGGTGHPWSRVVSSPRQRARAAAAEFATAQNVPLIEDTRFAEMDYGEWDGCRFADLRADAEVYAAFRGFAVAPEKYPPPGGETWEAFTDRICDGLDALAALADNDADDATSGGSVVICHAGVIRTALHLACGLPVDALWRLRVGYAARVTLSYGRGDDGALWGEIIEVVQAPATPGTAEARKSP